jgi:hypothetical protein
MSDEVGGTKIQRKQPPQQMMQQGPPPQQMMMQQGPPQQQMMMQQGPPPQMMQQGPPPQMMQQGPPPQMMQGGPPPHQMMQGGPDYPNAVGPMGKVNFGAIKGSKSGLGDNKTNKHNIKYAFIVALIFIILNSKIIWKQITKLPFMGTVEPSIIALVVNSILAGIIYYIITTFVIKN